MFVYYTKEIPFFYWSIKKQQFLFSINKRGKTNLQTLYIYIYMFVYYTKEIPFFYWSIKKKQVLFSINKRGKTNLQTQYIFLYLLISGHYPHNLYFVRVLNIKNILCLV